MKPKTNIFVGLVVLAAMLAGKQAAAQSESRRQGVTVVSETAGTVVRFEGAFTFIGKTPFTVSQNLAGPYKVIASKRGYETKTIVLDFQRGMAQHITVGLKPLSLAKAAFGSLLLPGTGQRYKGARSKGLIFTTLALGAGARAFVKHQQFGDDRDAAASAEKQYNQISDTALLEKELALEKWQKAQREANDSFKSRRRAVILTGAIWTINVLEALIAPPGPGHPEQTRKVGLNVTSSNGTTTELGLKIKF